MSQTRIRGDDGTPQRSLTGRIAGYPLVTILIGFILFHVPTSALASAT